MTGRHGLARSAQKSARQRPGVSVEDGAAKAFPGHGEIEVNVQRLQRTGDDQRTLLMTFSEFGRRAAENGSKGTDHGSGSCLFVVGPGVKAGPCGKHPSLTDLIDGDLKYHTDFRRVYATLLEGWLNVDGKMVDAPFVARARAVLAQANREERP